jgi:NAD(P)H-flavin reductase
VTRVRALTPDVLEADLRLEEPRELAFEAGQWVSVPFGPKTVRAYSIASTPASAREITLCADVSPDGIGSRWFRGLEAGVEVEFKAPLGGFVYGRADPRRPLFVAEEIGIVPIRAILVHLHETGFGRPVRLVYWARDPAWLVYDDDFRWLARRYPGFVYHPVVGSGASGRAGKSGDPGDAVRTLVDDVDGLVACVAGGQRAIDRVREVLMARGLERRAVRWERFW